MAEHFSARPQGGYWVGGSKQGQARQDKKMKPNDRSQV
jgi:hypothetical protein